MLQDPGVPTVLASKSLSRHSVVQILRIWTPTSRISQLLTILASELLSCHNWVQILLSRGARAFRKSKSLKAERFGRLIRHSVVQILATSWAADPPHLPAFRSWLSDPAKPQNYGKHTAFRAIPTRQNLLISHISAVSHLRDHISWLTDLRRQLSIKSEVRFLNFLWYLW